MLGGPRTLNGPQGGLAFYLGCPDGSQFGVPPAPALASEEYAAELVELYWASLLRDVAFTHYASDPFAVQAATKLSSMPSYKGPRDASNKVTADLLFRGGFADETRSLFVSVSPRIPDVGLPLSNTCPLSTASTTSRSVTFLQLPKISMIVLPPDSAVSCTMTKRGEYRVDGLPSCTLPPTSVEHDHGGNPAP